MYTMVLMMAMSGSGDVASFGGKHKNGNGCNGAQTVSNGCSGYTSCAGSTSCSGSSKSGGFLGLRSGGGGFLGLRGNKNSDHSSCNGCSGYNANSGCAGAGSYSGCTGHNAYSGCTGHNAYTGCTGHMSHANVMSGCNVYSTGCTGGMIYGQTAVSPMLMPATGTTGSEKKPDPKPADTKKTDDK